VKENKDENKEKFNMKKLFVIALAAIMVFSLTAVSMAAITTSGLARFYWVDNSGADSFNKTQVRINFDSDVNDFVSYYTQLRVFSGDNNDPFLWDYYAILKPDFGTFQIGQWENDFFGDVDVLSQFKTDEFTDSLWLTPWAIQFAPKLAGGFSAAVWYNPADNNATDPVKGHGNPVLIGSDAYTVSLDYANDAFAVQAALGDLGTIADNTYDKVTLLNASYKLDNFKFFLHYGYEGKNNPFAAGLAGNEAKNEILGIKATVPNIGFATQLEYDLAPDKDKPIGLGLYYSANKVDYTYYYVTQGSDTTYQTFRLQVNF
jgi:hypothetical protein